MREAAILGRGAVAPGLEGAVACVVDGVRSTLDGMVLDCGMTRGVRPPGVETRGRT
jgi:hypothetical protein